MKTYFVANRNLEIEKTSIPENAKLFPTPKPSVVFIHNGLVHEVFETKEDAKKEIVRMLKQTNKVLINLIKKFGAQ